MTALRLDARACAALLELEPLLRALRQGLADPREPAPDAPEAVVEAGVVRLLEPGTGATLALLDAKALGAACAGVGSALAAHALAREGAASAAVLGANPNGRWQLRALAHLRRLERAFIYDPAPFRAGPFASRLARDLGERAVKLVAADSLAEALLEAEVVLAAATPPPLSPPLLYPDVLAARGHVSATEPRLLAAELLADARVVVAERRLALELGLAEHAVAELGEVLRGERPGRRAPGERTLYLGAAPAWQLAAAARQVYARALGNGAKR